MEMGSFQTRQKMWLESKKTKMIENKIHNLKKMVTECTFKPQKSQDFKHQLI
jgi:hypothetical protein